MRMAWGFLVRDLRSAWSYRFSFVVQSVSLLFSLVSLRFLSDLFGDSVPTGLATYGGDYFGFALVGAALSLLSYPMVKSFAGAVRSAQVTGTFEAMLTTRANGVGVVLCSGIFPIVIACLQAVLAVAVGALLLGARLHVSHLALALLVLPMTATCLAGVGLMSAAFAIAFKQSEPFSGAMLAGSFLIGGILYPTSVLPAWLAALAQLLPITHAAALSRALLLDGAYTSAVAVHFLALGGFCLLFPAGVVLLSAAIRYAKRAGTLAHY
jgi:ABC-2 type transport system permease protein